MLTKPGLTWVSMFSMFSVISLIILLLILITKIPKVDLGKDERVENISAFKELFRNRYVPLYILGQFLYVGLEVGVATWLSQFLMEYRGIDPQTVGARTVALFWGGFTAGSLLTFVLLKIFDSRHILIAASGISALFFGLALFGPGAYSIAGFILLGFGISPMWPINYSLAMNSVPEHHGALSGLLVTSFVGGAVVPLIIGAIGDAAGLRAGMLIVFPCLVYIGTIGFWAKPLVTNKRLKDRKDRSHG